MKLEKYIRQLLLENEMVIVPGFGAFISEYIPAVVDDASGEIQPPSSKLIFNPKIKNNDGLLVGMVAEATRSTHFEALQKIEKERDNILYQLDKGDKVELDGLGILSYNAEKEVIFISEEDKHLSLETFGLEATRIEETVEEEEPAETTPEPVALEEEVPVEEEIAEKETAEEEEKTEEPEEVITVENKTQPQEKPVSNEPEEKKKRKAGWIWLLIILIPLLVVSVFIFMKQNKPAEPVKTIQQPEIKTVTPDTTPAKDTATIDSATAEITDTTSVEEAVQEKQVETTGVKFYLVGGSFKSEENAETFLQTLKEKGFEPFHMGKYGNFFIVGIGSYNTEAEAITAKQVYLDQNPGSGVWILER